MERTEHDFFNMPAPQIAHSLRTIYEGDAQMAHTETTGNSRIHEFKKALEEVVSGLTAATQTALESQHHYFETVIKEFMDSVQSALNDIDVRLNLLSQAQGQTEETLDAFLKLWMLGNNRELDLTDQKEIINRFLKRGLPAPAVEDTAALLTGIVAEKANDQTATADVEA
jgi:hypothetical protein